MSGRTATWRQPVHIRRSHSLRTNGGPFAFGPRQSNAHSRPPRRVSSQAQPSVEGTQRPKLKTRFKAP
eukprot:98165-Prymnesium_polylepis.1